ncbi:hypothetical protein AB0C21_25885 [Spirillospora sp. NPDC049024]
MKTSSVGKTPDELLPSPVADLIREAVSRHVPASVLNSPNVRIIGTGPDRFRGAWYGITLRLDEDDDCVYADYWLPEEGETGQASFSVWRNGVESQRTPEWVE